jgi:hypothetical protein
LFGGLAVATVPAHASTSTVTTRVEVCDVLSDGIPVDLWHGKELVGRAVHGHCFNQPLVADPGTTIQLFLENEGVEISQLTLINNQPITVHVTGTAKDGAKDVHQSITIND